MTDIDADLAQVIDLARRGEAKTITVSGPGITAIPVLFLPNANGGVDALSVRNLVDEWRTRPERATGKATAFTLAGFVALVNRLKLHNSAIFAKIDNISAPTLMAVINYNGEASAPEFGDHRVLYSYPVAREWRQWLENDGKAMNQADFAAFIEEHIAEIGDPDDYEESKTVASLFRSKVATASDLHTFGRGIELSAEINVKQAVSLSDGRISVVFDEGEHKDGAGQPVKIPGLFLIRTPFFVDGAAGFVVARLRYKLSNGKITWHYRLWKHDHAIRAALHADLERVSVETELPAYEATPEV